MNNLSLPFGLSKKKDEDLDDPLPDDYDKCADYNKPRHAMSETKFWALRTLFNLPNLALTIYTAATDPLKILFWFESEWGVFLTALSSLVMILACFDKRVFQKPAVILQSFAMGFNIIITPIFWLLLTKYTVIPCI